MTDGDRNTILSTVDILRALGGNNGLSNLQPKTKKTLLHYASELNGIVERDIQRKHSSTVEAFDGEFVYGEPEKGE